MNIKVLSDPICPMCYIAIGVMDELIKEFDLTVEWINVNAHPHFGEGIKLSEYKKSYEGYLESKKRYKGIARKYGLYFPVNDYIPSPQPALNAIYEAKKLGRGGAFKRLIMAKHHVYGEDIGDIEVIVETANELGIDPLRIRRAVELRLNDDLIAENTERAYSYGMKKSASGVVVLNDQQLVASPFSEPSKLRHIIEQHLAV